MRCKTTSSAASRLAALLALVALAAPACRIERYYIGSELPLRDMDGTIVVGTTTKAQILSLLGAPDELLRQLDGDIFVYRYRRVNTKEIKISEPVITNTEFFTYRRTDEKSDRVVILFDGKGLVSGVGTRLGTADLDAPEKG